MQKHSITLTLPHEEIKFFAGFFLGRAGAIDSTNEMRHVAQENFMLLMPYFDQDQKNELNEVVTALYKEKDTTFDQTTIIFFDNIKLLLQK